MVTGYESTVLLSDWLSMGWRNGVGQSWLFLSLLLPCVAVELGVNSQTTFAQPLNHQQAERNYQSAREIIAQGSLFAAKPKLQQALKIYQTTNDRSGQYNCHIELARIDYREGKYQQARSKLRLAQAANYSAQDGQVKTLLGLIALELGDYHEARSKLQIGVHELRINGFRDRLGRIEEYRILQYIIETIMQEICINC